MGLEGLGNGCRRFSKGMVRTRRDSNLDSRIGKNPVPDPEPKYPRGIQFRTLGVGFEPTICRLEICCLVRARLPEHWGVRSSRIKALSSTSRGPSQTRALESVSGDLWNRSTEGRGMPLVVVVLTRHTCQDSEDARTNQRILSLARVLNSFQNAEGGERNPLARLAGLF